MPIDYAGSRIIQYPKGEYSGRLIAVLSSWRQPIRNYYKEALTPNIQTLAYRAMLRTNTFFTEIKTLKSDLSTHLLNQDQRRTFEDLVIDLETAAEALEDAHQDAKRIFAEVSHV